MRTLWMLIMAVFLLASPCCHLGCAPNTEPMERMANKVMETVVAPVAAKAVEEVKTRAATLQGGAQVLEPGYETEIEGYLVQGFKGTITIKLKGVAGQLTGHAQGDQGPDLAGGAGDETTGPSP